MRFRNADEPEWHGALVVQLSPDGTAWRSRTTRKRCDTGGFDHFEIYLKQVGSSDVRRLTTSLSFFAEGIAGRMVSLRVASIPR
jgi:hypothetical protein